MYNKSLQRWAEDEVDVWFNVFDGAKMTLSLTLSPTWLLIEIQTIKMMNRIVDKGPDESNPHRGRAFSRSAEHI